MNTISRYILDLLKDDMVSHGLLVQCVEQIESSSTGSHEWKDILGELLTGEVEIGTARTTADDYVEFIAWKGSVVERVMKAVECVNNAAAFDREFAYWLCLRKNVDGYEEEGQ